MAKPIKQIILSPEQVEEMLERIAELAQAEQTARVRCNEAAGDLAAATQGFVEEAGLAASVGVVHRLYPPRSEL